MGGLSRDGGFLYYTEVFPEIPDDAVHEKNLDVFVVPLVTNIW